MDLMRMRTTRILAGLAAAPVCIALADLSNPQWSWIEVLASYFVNGRAGWLITIAGVGVAVASASLIGPAAARTRGHRSGLWLLGVWSAGMLVAGLVPADPPGQWDDPSAANLIHGAGGLAAFLALPAAAVLLTWGWRRDERWRHARRSLTVAAVATVVTLCAFAVAWVDVIARRLFISPSTAKTHVTRAIAKLEVRDRVQLVILAYETGLVRPSSGPGR